MISKLKIWTDQAMEEQHLEDQELESLSPCHEGGAYDQQEQREMNEESESSSEAQSESIRFSVNDSIEQSGLGMFQLLLFAMGCTCWMCDAIEILLISYILPTLQAEWKLSGVEKACVASVLFVGMLVGAILFGWLADRYGRRKALIINLVYSTVPTVLCAFAPNWTLFVATRTCTGIGVAGMQIIYGLISEFLPTKRRALVLLTMTTLGTMIASLLVTGLAWVFLPHVTIDVGSVSVKSWRLYLLILSIPLIVVAILSPLLPESPRFDMLQGNQQKALRTLRTMARLNNVTMISGELVLNESKETVEVEESTRMTSRLSNTKFGLLFHPNYRYLTIILAIIWFVSNFSFFGVQLLSAEYLLGDGQAKYIRIFLPAVADIPIVMCHILIVNKLGRKRTMIITYGLGSLLMLSLMIPSTALVQRILIVLARISIQAAFATAILATPEYLPTEIRTTGLGFVSGISRFAGMVAPFFSSALFEVSRAVPLLFFSATCVVAAIVAFFLPYDTTGTKLAETVTNKQAEINT